MAAISFDPFLTLKQIHALPDLPERLHALTFPELLLEGADREYEAVDLTADHALFSQINLLIGALVEYRDLSPLLGQIEAYYREYIGKVCATGGRAIFQSKELIDNRGRTPLHHAARSGQMEEVERLLRLGALVNAADLDGYTPLHIAVRHGHRAIVERLIAGGGDPTLVTSEGETLLHLAADGGDDGLVWLVLNEIALFEQPLFRSPQRVEDGSLPIDRASAEKWLHKADKNGAIPLHRAVCGASKPEIVRLLIEAGTRLNRENNSGDTALGWSIRNGHLESSLLLLEESPFQAITPSSRSSPTKSRERAAEESLWEAIEKEDLYGQIVYLARRTELFLEQRDYRRAALTYNGAYAIADGPCKRLILSQLQEIEKRFILTETGREPSESKILDWRSKLMEARQEIASSFAKKQPLDLALKELSQSYKELLCDLLEEAIRLKGQEPPTRFAMVGLGSMSRDEICPYSDVEFLFLIEDDCEKNRAYFRSISRLMELFIINLGETSFKIIRGEESLTPSGFSLDIGGISPFGDWDGKERTYELIGSPQVLADFQYLDNIILVNAMATSCLITGDKGLFDHYQSEVNAILNAILSDRRRLRQRRALELIEGDLQEFQPQLNLRKIKLGVFGVKKELYRPLQSLISNLALCYGAGRGNGFERIDRLKEIRVISTTGAVQLKRAFRLIFELRIKAHLFYREECELLHQRGSDASRGGYLVTSKIRLEITEIYRILIPLHQKTLEFLNGNIEAFANCSFYDESVGNYDDRDRKEFQFTRARESAERSAALRPNHSSTRWNLGLVQGELGQSKNAIKSFKETLALCRKKYNNQEHLNIASSLSNLGNAYADIKKLPKAINYYKSSLEMMERISGATLHPTYVGTLMDLGSVYGEQGDYDRAITALIRAQEQTEKIPIDEDYSEDDKQKILLMIFNKMGNVYARQKKSHLAIKYYKLSLERSNLIHEEPPLLDIARVFQNLGTALCDTQQFEEAIQRYKSSLGLLKSIYQREPHPLIAQTLNSLGTAYQGLGNLKKAFKNYKLSLAQAKRLHDAQSSLWSIKPLKNLGDGYKSSGDLPKSAKYFERAYQAAAQFYKNEPNQSSANALHSLGLVHEELGNLQQMIECHNLFLLMHRDPPNEKVATTLNHLSVAHFKQKEFAMAVMRGEEFLEMARQIHTNPSHPQIIYGLMNLGISYAKLNQFQKAIESLKEAHSKANTIYHGQPHPDIINILINLGTVYQLMNETSSYYANALEMLETINESDYPEIKQIRRTLNEALAVVQRTRGVSSSEG